MIIRRLIITVTNRRIADWAIQSGRSSPATTIIQATTVPTIPGGSTRHQTVLPVPIVLRQEVLPAAVEAV
jgi:hypothetical protein